VTWVALAAVTMGSTGSMHRVAHMGGMPMPGHAHGPTSAPATERPADPGAPQPTDSGPGHSGSCPCIASCHAGVSTAVGASVTWSIPVDPAVGRRDAARLPDHPVTRPVRFVLPLANAPPLRLEAAATI